MLFVHCWYIQSESVTHSEFKGSDPSELIVIKDAFRHSKLESPSTPVKNHEMLANSKICAKGCISRDVYVLYLRDQ